MGGICARSNDERSNSPLNKQNSTMTKTIKDSISLPGVQFYLQQELLGHKKNTSDSNIIKPDSCLLIFSEFQASLDNHPMLSKFQEKAGCKVQQFIDAKNLTESQEHAQNQQIVAQNTQRQEKDVMIMPITIKGLRFNKICIVRVNVWAGTDQKLRIAEQLTEKLQRALQKIVDLKIGKLVITDINNQFGIPTQICAKSLCQAIAGYYQDIQWVGMVCSNQDSLDIHEQFLKAAVIRKQTSHSLGAQQVASSIYY